MNFIKVIETFLKGGPKVINYSRALNIQGFTRRIGTKIVRVNPHSRKAGVLRAREALKDLRKSKVEAAYIMNKSGKLSKKISQNMPKQVKTLTKHGKSIPLKNVSVVMHNHPVATPPSPPDIQLANTSKTIGAVVSSDGTMYSFRPGKNPDPQYHKKAEMFLDWTNEIGKDKKLSLGNRRLVYDTLITRYNKSKGGQVFKYKVYPSPYYKELKLQNQEKVNKAIDAHMKKVPDFLRF